MVSTKLTIHIPLGLHLRPVSKLCNHSILFKSTITLKTGTKSVNAKSVLGVLSACIKYGHEIELICEGEDENEALVLLSEMIESGLGEKILKK